MDFFLGAILSVAAITVLHLGRLAVRRLEVIAPARERVAADTIAIVFAAMLGAGLMMLLRGVMAQPDMLHLAALVIAGAAVLAGSALSAMVVGRLARASAVSSADAPLAQ